MKSVVDSQTAQSEGSDKQGTNHPVVMRLLDKGNRTVRTENAKGFTRARKIAGRLIDRAHVYCVAVFCSTDTVPEKFRNQFKEVNVDGRPQTCFLVGA